MRPVLLTLAALAFTAAALLVAAGAWLTGAPVFNAVSSVVLVWAGAFLVYLTPRRSPR